MPEMENVIAIRRSDNDFEIAFIVLAVFIAGKTPGNGPGFY